MTTTSDTAKMRGLHPKLIAAIKTVKKRMALHGFTMIVTDGVRSTSEQQALYSKGRRKVLGHWFTVNRKATVTDADGIKVRSNHQPHADGYGRAADLAFVVDGRPSWSESLPWALYGHEVRAAGCGWGGDWRTRYDGPHMELFG